MGRLLFASQTSTVGNSQPIGPFASPWALPGCCAAVREADKVNFVRWSSYCGWLWCWLWTVAKTEGKGSS